VIPALPADVTPQPGEAVQFFWKPSHVWVEVAVQVPEHSGVPDVPSLVRRDWLASPRSSLAISSSRGAQAAQGSIEMARKKAMVCSVDMVFMKFLHGR
jgi:hypothetical protein